MIARLPVTLAAVAALFTVASAQLEVLSPGGSNEWWVANTSNLLVWNCKESQVQTFNVLVDNPNMASAEAIIAQQANFDCSLTVTQDQMGGFPVGTGYTVQFANPINDSDIYAQSSPFEIKAANSPFPSTTSVDSATVTSASGTSAGSSSASPTSGSSSDSSKSNDSASLKASMGYATAFAAAIVGMYLL